MIIKTTYYVVMETGSTSNHIFEQLKLSPKYICNNMVPCLLKMPLCLDLVWLFLCTCKRVKTKDGACLWKCARFFPSSVTHHEKYKKLKKTLLNSSNVPCFWKNRMEFLM